MIFSLGKCFIRKFLTALLALFFLLQNSFAYSPYSNSELEELEKEFIQQINQSNSVIRNPLANQYINHLAKRLVRNTMKPIPYFFIVKSNEINAFAGPGGYIGVNSQLILASDNESELAAVMAHEIAHVKLHHLYRIIEHSKQMRVPMLASVLASIALGVVNPALGSGALMASITGIAQDNINFTRASEKEADRIGIDMLIKSGLNPEGMAAFFKKLQMSSRYYYRDNIPAILRTHPLDEDRIAEAENRSAHLPHKTYLDSVDYRFFKEIVRNSSGKNNQELLDFYKKECRKQNSELACQYGQALTLLNLNHFSKANDLLLALKATGQDNLYLSIARAQVDIGLKAYSQAVSQLKELYENFPDNYAVVVYYAKGLMAASQAQLAAATLLKASRQYKNDLPICLDLALAEAESNRKDYAYFTQAQCELLQGRAHAAMQQLKLALSLAKNDAMLSERIKAKMQEIKLKLN
ncbi:Zn-dependent protease (plasmid) [Legionella adelaidensis]|uniref:Zn-dependent protease n=1 Tax=Legionella adelaidensis TaxID=45056 RepID=A0A0W0R424_9GAMM|nr:M48 family metalloprotease [Legionella adelaidensis]KTC65811.1 Zn-dependent protease [Legionella adelaidensis]VEH85239.1 Zn-dependent protease [Legionella adelaidensis]